MTFFFSLGPESQPSAPLPSGSAIQITPAPCSFPDGYSGIQDGVPESGGLRYFSMRSLERRALLHVGIGWSSLSHKIAPFRLALSFASSVRVQPPPVTRPKQGEQTELGETCALQH